MAFSKKENLRGATRRVEAQPREWRLPSLTLDINIGYLFAPLLILAILVAGYMYAQKLLIRSVKVQGDFSIWAEDDVIQQVDWTVGEKFFSINLDQVYLSLVSMPLINDVKINKKWPGDIEIKVIENIPMALWNSEKIIDNQGALSDIPDHYNVSNLTLINSEYEDLDKAIKLFTRVQRQIKNSSIQINEITISNLGSMSMVLNNQWQVNLGNRDLEQRIYRLKELLERLPKENIAHIDLRYGKGAAIRWNNTEEHG